RAAGPAGKAGREGSIGSGGGKLETGFAGRAGQGTRVGSPCLAAPRSSSCRPRPLPSGGSRRGSSSQAASPSAAPGGPPSPGARPPPHPLFHLLARLERDDELGRHVHLVAGARVARLARLALLDLEDPEVAQLDPPLADQGLDDGVERLLDDFLR